MQFTIAIQPDNYGPGDSGSFIWTRKLRESGHLVRTVSVYSNELMKDLNECDGFMWRFAHWPNLGQIARRILPVIENYLGLVVYPDQRTCWHYDDKIAQKYLLEVAEISTPQTWVWYDAEMAKEWSLSAQYPLVLKLARGAASKNVRLISSHKEAEVWIDKLFSRGVYGFNKKKENLFRLVRQRLRAIGSLLIDEDYIYPKPRETAWELHKNYVLFQEFLPDNSYDTRVTIVGRRAFGFRRYNREDDFRASGSGKIDWSPECVDPKFIRLAFRTAETLGCQSCAIDGLYRGNEPVIGEISYTYVSWAVHKCPGHWELKGDPDTGELIWKEGKMWAEEAQVADFLQRLKTHKQ